MSWVRVRLMGKVSGRRLDGITARMPVRRVCAVAGGMEMDVPARGVKALRGVLRGSGVRMRIVRRYGLLRVRRAAKKRGALVAGACAALLAVLYLTQVAAGVRVVGAKDAVQERQMLAVLEQSGVRRGAWVGGVDVKGAAEEILSEFPGLTYAQVRRSGLQLELYVVQATPAPQVVDDTQCVDVVASSGGLVTRVVALSGEAMVQAGDTVVEGQVLIRGTEKMPHARGSVTARVWAVGVGKADTTQETAVRTGASAVERYVSIGSWRFPKARELPFADCEVEEQRRALGGAFVPLYAVRREAHEVVRQQEQRKISLVKDESRARAMTNALIQVKNGACVVDKRVEYSIVKDGQVCVVRAVATLECINDIAVETARGEGCSFYE